MATREKAVEIAATAHAGVKDKQGQPYLLHPLRVMQGVEGETAQIVAALHDVVEDTPITFEDLALEGFSEEVLAALRLVTHDDGQSYADYVIACKANPIARQVKHSDLRDNANLSRLLLRPEKFATDAQRMQRYVLSYRFLEEEMTDVDYKKLMAAL
ncbi:HD domain-containing protein [Blastopirellula retiformator]|uniref:GTP pyrophosphokinase n=1 Tax=Blastopirellula retiformator TaxID=2527970 RepID=A0A5C5UVZ9_9BACT|nr:HD domain-containing protein [Blastopirellula retiformator]TWT29535.1 GTP pyrophosphokinase [Blastopirellula retiformator]